VAGVQIPVRFADHPIVANQLPSLTVFLERIEEFYG